MIRHIVLFRLKRTLTPEERLDTMKTVKTRLEALVGVVPNLESLTVSFDCNKHDYDLCLEAELPTLDAVAAYRDHPAHRKVQEYIHSVIEGRAAVDFEF